jgi:hypothetical protein
MSREEEQVDAQTGASGQPNCGIWGGELVQGWRYAPCVASGGNRGNACAWLGSSRIAASKLLIASITPPAFATGFTLAKRQTLRTLLDSGGPILAE